MNSGQSGIFAFGASAHIYLEFDLISGGKPIALVKIASALFGSKKSIAGITRVIGFRPEHWRTISPDQIPNPVKGFNQLLLGAQGFTMPATQHDLFIWIAGPAYDRVFDAACEAISALADIAILADETDGWVYQSNRDLTGFIDGTENPSPANAPDVVLIPAGQPGAGGSILLVQKWIHDIKAWESLAVSDQEKAIGRMKSDSAELPEEVRGSHAHVSRMVIEENGKELPIFRRNTSFGTPTAHGTMFIGFSAEQHRLARMLERMAGAEDGIRDSLTYYASALTGSYYFVPSVQALQGFASEI